MNRQEQILVNRSIGTGHYVTWTSISVNSSLLQELPTGLEQYFNSAKRGLKPYYLALTNTINPQISQGKLIYPVSWLEEYLPPNARTIPNLVSIKYSTIQAPPNTI